MFADEGIRLELALADGPGHEDGEHADSLAGDARPPSRRLRLFTQVSASILAMMRRTAGTSTLASLAEPRWRQM